MNYRDRIVRDPLVCAGEPVIKGTRVTLRTLLASLSDGDSIEDILTDYPTLTADDVRAVITRCFVVATDTKIRVRRSEPNP